MILDITTAKLQYFRGNTMFICTCTMEILQYLGVVMHYYSKSPEEK